MSRHLLELFLATALALLSFAPGLLRPLPLWGRATVRLGIFLLLTVAVALALGSPVAPDYGPPDTDARVWGQFVEAGWISSLALLAVASMRVFVVLEGKPRETRIVSDLIAAAIFVCAALTVANLVFALPVRGLVATSGVLAIVLGLALQNSLADVFSGIAVNIERPYRPGDLLWVEGSLEGTVLEVNWRSTRLATGDRNVAIIPNSVIAKARLINRSAPTPMRSESITVRLDASVSPDLAAAPLLAAALSCRTISAVPAPSVHCTGLAGDGNSFEIGFAVPASGVLAAARTELWREVHRHLLYSGIALAVAGSVIPAHATAPPVDELLHRCDLFGSLPDADRALLASHFSPVDLAVGDTLLTEGAITDGFFVIAAGVLAITRIATAGTDVIHRLGPGETIGALAFITEKPSQATVTALTPVRAWRLDWSSLRIALARYPQIGTAMEAMADRASTHLRLEVDAVDASEMAKPEVFTARLRHLLSRLAA